MRPLWRNALWLAFAAACGVGGAYYGVGRSAEMLGGFSTALQRSDAFAEIRRALPIVASGPQGPLADYADANLRSAILRLGELSYVDHGCSTRERAQLARASAWLSKRATSGIPAADPLFRKGVDYCQPPKN
jgi:hypothetical protein